MSAGKASVEHDHVVVGDRDLGERLVAVEGDVNRGRPPGAGRAECSIIGNRNVTALRTWDRPSRTTGAMKTKQAAASAAICCTLALAACGSTSTGSGQTNTNASNAALLVKYSDCMRSHGVTDFPDPSTNETPNSFGVDGYNFDLPTNLNTKSPVYESANKACEHLTNPGGGGSHNFNVAKARQAALAHAECMRRHGVPNYPDPKVSGGVGGISVGSDGSGINPRSPAFQQAQKICQPGAPR